MKEPEIEKMLCLSTAHLTPAIFTKLENDEYYGLVFYPKVDVSSGDCYGGWLFIDRDQFIEEKENLLTTSIIFSDDYNALPIDLQRIVLYSDSYDANWIMFDSDCYEVDNLPTYDDEWKQYEMMTDIINKEVTS